MPGIVWILIMAAALVALAYFLIRERRSGKAPVSFDADAPRRAVHAETRVRRDGRGPNMQSPGGF